MELYSTLEVRKVEDYSGPDDSEENTKETISRDAGLFQDHHAAFRSDRNDKYHVPSPEDVAASGVELDRCGGDRVPDDALS